MASPSTSKTLKIAEKSSSGDAEESELMAQFEIERNDIAKDIMGFRFEKSRVRILNGQASVKKNSNGVIYWMIRDQRVQDNWAFLYAQQLAMESQTPLCICYCLLPNCLDVNKRQYRFMVRGLQEIEEECHRLNIDFHLFSDNGGNEVPKFVKKHIIGAVVCDFSPLRIPMQWIENLKHNTPSDVTVIQVDAHNIVPVWETSDIQEYSARTFRKKINIKLKTYLTGFPPLVRHPYDSRLKSVRSTDCWKHVKIEELENVNWAKPGYTGAVQQLDTFCTKRLKIYSSYRDDPLLDVQSDLSPWFHFGQIAPQRAALEVEKYRSKYSKSVAAFLEQAIVRRELADNFCFYNKHYDSLEGCTALAQKTLNEHRIDERKYVYTLDAFEEAKTHDNLRNATQLQLTKDAKIHGYMRMYWAKKMLECSNTPENALKTAIYLNDKFSMDGQDPNGYVGCMWSIGGIHDEAQGDRAIFGRKRFMHHQQYLKDNDEDG